MVTDYSKRVLGDPRMLGNLLTDLLPDLPRERSLLVTAAEADVAADLTRHVEEHHMDPDTAIQLVARSLCDRRALDPAASTWVTTEYAQALGYRTRSGAPPAVPPAADPTRPVYGAYGSPYEQTGPRQDQPPGTVDPGYPPPQVQPPWQPPPRPPRQRSRWPIVAAVGGTAAVVIFVVAAFAGGLFTSSPTTSTTTSSQPPTTAPASSPRASVASLIELLPGDINDPAGQCAQLTPQFAAVGVVQAIQCDDPGLPHGMVLAYQMNSHANYLKTLAAFGKWSSYTKYTPGSTCPLSGGNRATARGETTWDDLYFPQRPDQTLTCEWIGSTLNMPAYAWTFPSENAFLAAAGPANSTFAALNSWWMNHADPSASPTPVATSS